MATWDQAKSRLTEAGFSESETQNIAFGLAQKMQAQGNGPEDFENFFGKPKEPETGHLSEMFDQQFKRNMPMQDPAREANDQNSLLTAVKAGIQNTVIGLGVRHGLPDTEIEPKSLFFEGAPMAMRLAQGATTAIGDLPVNAAGFLAAGPGGAFGLPQAMRAAMVKSYQQGGIHSFKDFWNVATNTAVEGAKGYVTGGVAGIAGAAAKTAAMGTNVAIQTVAPLAAEVTAMTGAGAALEGKMPEPKDFLDNAILVAGLHATLSPIQAKLQQAFSDTGMHPHDVAVGAINDGVLKQQVLSENKETPEALSGLKQPVVKSDFVIKDGRLIPGDKPEAQAEFNFEPTTVSKMIEDSQERFSLDKRVQAARLHDPEAFRAMEGMSRDLREGQKRIEDNTASLEQYRESEEKLSQLNEVRQNLSNTKNLSIPEQQALGEKETELSQNEEKLQKDAATAKSLRDENATIQTRMDRIGQNSNIKSRLAEAWQKGQKTLEANLKDRITNKVIELRDEGSTKLLPNFNADFSDPKAETPEVTTEGKVQLMNDDNLHLFYGDEGRELTRDQVMSQILRGHEELASKIAPEIVTRETTPSETGKAKTTLQIGPRAKPSGEKVTVSNLLRDFYNDQHKSKSLALETAENLGKPLPLDARPDIGVLKARASNVQAESFIGRPGEKESSAYGVYDPKTGEKTSDSLMKIIEDNVAPKDVNDFRKYLIYKHAIDLNAAGELTGVNDVESRNFVKENAGKFDTAQKKFTDWNNAVLDYAAKSGRLSPELVSQLKEKYPNYVSTARLTEEMESKGSGFNRKNVLYSREGSELPFVDPITTSLEKAQNIARAVAENNAKLAMVKLSELQGAGNSLFKEISPKVSIDSGLEINQDPTFARSADERAKLDDNQVGYFDNGNYKVVQFNDPELAKTLKFVRYDAGVLKSLLKWLSVPAKLVRFGVSSGPDFLMKHILRSEIFTSVVGDEVRAPLMGTLSNLAEAMGKTSDMYVEAKKAGALDGVLTDINGFVTDKNFAMQDKEGFLSRSFNVMKSTFGIMHTLMRVSEEAKLLSIYKDKVGKLGPDATWGDKLQAGWETSRSSVNGLQIGAKMQGVNSLIAFMHYETQGLGRTIESGMENPARFATRAALMTAASVALWYSHKDDAEYNDKPDYEKNAFWHIKVGDSYVKIAKPWEMGVFFGSLPERILDWQKHDDPEAIKSLGNTLADMIPVKHPAIIDQYEALANNINSMTGRNIIPDHLMQQAPESQVTTRTSQTAVAIAKALSFVPGSGKLHLDSPIMVDHAIGMWLGQPGVLATQAIDKGLQASGITPPVEKPAGELADLPFIGGLISRHATYNAQPLQSFKEQFEELSKVQNTYTAFQKSGRFDEAREWYDKHPEIQNFQSLAEAHQAISEQNKAIQGVLLLPAGEMSPSDRKQSVEDMYRVMIDTAKQKLDELNESRKNVK